MQRVSFLVSFLLSTFLLSAVIAAEAENVPYEFAVEKGIKKCLPAIKEVTEFVIKDSQTHGSYSIWNTINPDTTTYTTTIETVFLDGSLISTATFTPDLSGNCNAILSQVYHTQSSCLKQANEVYENAKSVSTLAKQVEVLEKNDINYFLIPTNPGCMSLKQESLYYSISNSSK